MEKLLELEDIVLLPSVTNNGNPGTKANFMVKDDKDLGGISETLPIFTSPMEAIVGEHSCKIWTDYGIRPIIPRTELLDTRLRFCPWVFSSFSMSEIQKNFIDLDKRSLGKSIHISVDCGNGHNTNLLNLCYKLKQLYGNQVIIMGGNVANIETYSLYGKAGIDYMRAGISGGSLVDKREFGFHYPMASLLMDISKFKTTGGIGIPPVKIIADGEISCYADILKALALGADYVMVGKEFSRIIEAEGLMYKRSKNPNSEEYELEEVPDQEKYYGTSGYQSLLNGYCRAYHGNTCTEIQAFRSGYVSNEDWKKADRKVNNSWTWVDIDKSLSEWVEEFRDCANYGFTITNSKNWSEFKKNVRYGRI